FKGTPETVNGLLTGSVELIYAANQIVAPLIVGGQVRALAKLDRDAPPSMADIPTLAEAAGLPDLEDISVWLGLVAPKGTPKPIIEKIHAEVAKVLTDPAIKEKSERTGNYPVTNTPDEFSAFIRKEARRWEKVIKEAGIKFDSEKDAMTRRWIALAIVSALVMGTAAAQERPDAFPSRPLKIVVPFPAGGPSDVLARMIGQRMSEDWSQPVVVENRPGANTVLGAQQVAKAAPDGYTLLMAIDSTLTMNQYLYRTPPYDPFTDFAPVTLTAKTMQLLIVNAASDVRTVKELIAKARTQPGKLNYGVGT